jgi:branched-chain amino acid transport system permease protein
VLGLNLQWGFTGLFNVGVAGFVAVGAYTSAILTTPEAADRIGGFGWPVARAGWRRWASRGWPGWLVGALALRLRSDYLAIATFGIAVTIQLVATNAQALTGGTFGVQFIPKPMQGWLGTGLAWNAGLSGAGAADPGLLVYLALETLVRSPWGRVLRAIREDEDAASSLGKRAFVFRLQSFVIGSMLMGLGGARLRALRRLHRTRGLPAHPDLPAVGHADRRRCRQQPRRRPRRAAGVGLLGRRRQACCAASSRRASRRAPPRCRWC